VRRSSSRDLPVKDFFFCFFARKKLSDAEIRRAGDYAGEPLVARHVEALLGRDAHITGIVFLRA
jgi:hypothetical protein